MPKYVIEVRDESEGKSLGFYGGRVPVAVSGTFASYEVKFVDSINNAEAFMIELGATTNADSLAVECPGKVFNVLQVPSSTSDHN